jgi:hypothetical protein
MKWSKTEKTYATEKAVDFSMTAKRQTTLSMCGLTDGYCIDFNATIQSVNDKPMRITTYTRAAC